MTCDRDVPELHEPAGEEPEHADHVDVVPLLDHVRIQDSATRSAKRSKDFGDATITA